MPFAQRLQQTITTDSSLFIEHKKAGLQLRNMISQDSLIMSRKPWIAYYAGIRSVLLPYADFNRVMAFANHSGVNLIVIDENFIRDERPQLAFLLDPKQAPAYLKPIYLSPPYAQERIIIYRFDSQKFRDQL
jgi:hypothetical protein